MTPREPDRFDAQARELVARWYGPPLSRESVPWIAAALRAAESSALERAAQWHEERAARVEREAYSCPGAFLSDTDRDYITKRTQADRDDAVQIRALIPPAAAPECEWRCDACGDELASEAAQRRHEATWHAAAAPAAETNVCPRCGGDIDHGRNCAGEPAPAAEMGKAQGAEALLRECDDVLARVQGHGCPPSGESIAALRAKLAARAAPPEREGT